MKKAPYGEYFEFNDEVKEYKKFYKEKKSENEDYYLYLDWKNHINEKLSKFPKNDKNKALINFKRYIVNKKRKNEAEDGVSITILSCCFTLLLSKFVPSNLTINIIDEDNIINTQEFSLIEPWFIIPVAIFIVLTVTFIFGGHKLKTKVNHSFYCDLLELIDEFIATKEKSGTTDIDKQKRNNANQKKKNKSKWK